MCAASNANVIHWSKLIFNEREKKEKTRWTRAKEVEEQNKSEIHDEIKNRWK